MSNESLLALGGWSSTNLARNNVIFIIYILAAVLHFQVWLQLFIHKTKFDLSFIFSLGYTTTDLLLAAFYFIEYSIRIRSWISVTHLLCYFEAYGAFYINLLELYSLGALNICRYWLIVRNQNVYRVHRRNLILISIIIPLLILTNLTIQEVVGWCVVTRVEGASCRLSYTNNVVRIWNLVVVLTLPILISLYMLIRALQFLKNIHAQQLFIGRNHHGQLIIHSSIFYSIWLSLWLPLIIITFLDIDILNGSTTFAASLANTIETLIDPILSIFLDKRFAKAWKKSSKWIKQKVDQLKNNRVNPTA